MNDVTTTQQKKESILKSLAIVGFISIIIFIAWLSVQLVNFVPSAFTSLASLAESLNQREQTTEETEVASLLVTSNTTLASVGELVTVTWNTAKAPGSYTFSYHCTEGVAIDLMSVDGIKSINCDTNYNLGDTDSLTLTIDSEKERFADLRYTVSFLGTNDTKPRASGTATITVVNADIPDDIANLDSESEQEETTPSETEQTPDTTTDQPSTPTYEQEYVYTIPTSDPNGTTDLGVRFLNTGTIIGNTFFVGTLHQNENGALQFEVKNYGTKTSKDWTFSVTLPDGHTYESDTQSPLKPNERAVLTIGFTSDRDAEHTFVTKVSEPTDQTKLNNQFVQKVTLVR